MRVAAAPAAPFVCRPRMLIVIEILAPRRCSRSELSLEPNLWWKKFSKGRQKGAKPLPVAGRARQAGADLPFWFFRTSPGTMLPPCPSPIPRVGNREARRERGRFFGCSFFSIAAKVRPRQSNPPVCAERGQMQGNERLLNVGTIRFVSASSMLNLSRPKVGFLMIPMFHPSGVH